jgi:hypothetical protein
MSRQRLFFAVFGMILFGVESAQAQLFPNIYIRRQRPDCETESPIIKMHRDLYYGYHPTEWTRFPSGWGVSNPEVINREELAQQVKKEIERLEEEYGPSSRDDSRDMDLPPRGRQDMTPGDAVPRTVPLPSEENSPFNLDPEPKPRAATPANGANTPPATPELPKAGDSPFDLPPEKPASNPNNDEIPPRPKAATPRTGSLEMFDSGTVSAVEAPAEVMRAPQRNAFRDALGSLNPRQWIRR